MMEENGNVKRGPVTPNRIRIKCHYNHEIRTVSLLTSDCNFAKLKRRLSHDYGFEVILKYEDSDGDMITLASQNDLNDLLITEPETVNVIVAEYVLPDLPRRTPTGRSNSSSPALFAHSPATPQRQRGALLSPFFKGASGIGSYGSSGRLENLTVADDRSAKDRFPHIDNVGNGGCQAVAGTQIRWKRGEILGQGAFGVVYLGLNTDTGELMAVKQMAIDEVSSKMLKSLENEIFFLRSLRHPNIVRYVGTEITPAALSIFLEYVPGGSLKALVDKFGQLEESVAKSYTRQLLLGLEYLHRNGIAHRDIKGANCLVGNDAVIKLADFGNSKPWRADNNIMAAPEEGQAQPSGDIKGTPSWMAPEVIKEQGNHLNWKKADVWSLACTTLEMTTGKPPWAQFDNPVTILYHIACQETLPDYPKRASVELITFLNVCLQRDPSQRPDITSLLLHPFVANVGGSGWNNAAVSGFNQRPSTVSTAPQSDWTDSSGVSGNVRKASSDKQPKIAFGSQSPAHPADMLSPSRGLQRGFGTYMSVSPGPGNMFPSPVPVGRSHSQIPTPVQRYSNLTGTVSPSPDSILTIESRVSNASLPRQGLYPIDVSTHPETAHEIDGNNIRSTGVMTEREDSFDGDGTVGARTPSRYPSFSVDEFESSLKIDGCDSSTSTGEQIGNSLSSRQDQSSRRPSDSSLSTVMPTEIEPQSKGNQDSKSSRESSRESREGNNRLLIRSASLDSEELSDSVFESQSQIDQRIDDSGEFITDDEDLKKDRLDESGEDRESESGGTNMNMGSQEDLKPFFETANSGMQRKSKGSSTRTSDRKSVRLTPIMQTKNRGHGSNVSESSFFPGEPIQYRSMNSPLNEKGMMIITSAQGSTSISQGEVFGSPIFRSKPHGSFRTPPPQPSPNARSVLQSRQRASCSRQHTVPLTPLNELSDSLDMDRELQLRHVSVQGKSVTPKATPNGKKTMLLEFDDHDSLSASQDAYDETFATGIDPMSAVTLSEHTAGITKLRAPQRADLLLSSSSDGTIKLWGLGPEDLRSRMTLHASAFASSTKSERDGSESISKSASNRARSASETPFPSASTPKAPIKINGCWADDSCMTIWGACSDGGLRVWAGMDGKQIRYIQAHDETITAMEGAEVTGVQALTYMCTGSADRTIRVWDARAKRPQVQMFRGHTDAISAVRWTETGKAIISASKDKTVRIWDLRSGRCRGVLEKHFGAVSCLRTIPEDTSMFERSSVGSCISGGRDAMLNLWSSEGESLATVAAHRGPITFLSEVNCRYATRSGALAPAIISIGNDNLLKTWDLKRMKIINEIQVPNDSYAGSICRAVWVEQAMVTCSSTGVVKVYENLQNLHTAPPTRATKSPAKGISPAGPGPQAQGDAEGHTLVQLSDPCSDLIAAPSFIATGTKSGQIVKWSRR